MDAGGVVTAWWTARPARMSQVRARAFLPPYNRQIGDE